MIPRQRNKRFRKDEKLKFTLQTSRIAVLALGLAVAAPVTTFAQGQTLTGTVGAVFDGQFTVDTPQGQVLVTLPDDATAPQAGQNVRLTGEQTGNTFTASAVEPVAVPAPATASTTAPVPGMIESFGFTQILREIGKDDEFFGQLPDGTWLEIEYDRGRIEEIKAGEGSAIPANILNSVLPANLRNNDRLTALARITEIEFESDGDVEIDGYDADGMRVELEFDVTGTLEEVKISRDNRRSPTLEMATSQLTAQGYTDLGWANRGGRHIDVLARNPFGEMVLVRLNDGNRVDRERALR
jgi:hypothetical protein